MPILVVTGTAAGVLVVALVVGALAIAFSVTWFRQRQGPRPAGPASRGDVRIVLLLMLICGALPFVALGAGYIAWYVIYTLGVAALAFCLRTLQSSARRRR